MRLAWGGDVRKPAIFNAPNQATFDLMANPTMAGDMPRSRHGTAAPLTPILVREPNRGQVELRTCGLDSLLPEEHRARLVLRYVGQPDFGVLFDALNRLLKYRAAARTHDPKAAVRWTMRHARIRHLYREPVQRQKAR